MLKKGLKYNLRPTVGEDVPEWITSKKHTLPTLMYKNFSISDPMTIAEYIERTFPYNSLTRQGVLSYQEVLEQTANFYPSVTRYVLNNDPLKEDLLLKKVEDELDRLDKLLRSAPGQFICGVDISLADLYLLPRLFQANIVLDHFKDLEVYHLQSDPTRIALESYLSKVFSLEEMKDKRVAYNSDRVIHAWKLARARD